MPVGQVQHLPLADGPPPHGAIAPQRRGQGNAVAHWLLCAAPDRGQARVEWAESGVTLLACGVRFAAVRIGRKLVEAAAGTGDQETLDARLRDALRGGPVIADHHRRQFYALVPVRAAHRWEERDAVCLGTGSYLGVPGPDRVRSSPGRSYWPVPMEMPGRLCHPRAVEQLIAVGRRQLALAEQES
ncbi:hypothetical protein [Streptomyces albus]|uniref:hypothetical protein n=1 Tax=Streptomyces albus TaxID=1888 RepID=UPI00131B6664|nr:hypothetical protein [Streptomyces albus]